MAAELIDGKAVAKRLQESLAKDVADFVATTAREPLLAVVLVGDNPASKVYVQSKSKKARSVGMQVRDVVLPASTRNEALQQRLKELSADPAVDGILLQLPLPEGLDEFAALLCIAPEKDVDGLHPYSQGLLMRGAEGFKPCTPFGCMLLIREGFRLLGRDEEFSGLRAVVLGRSILVGKPMAALLLEESCTPTVCHSRTPDIASYTREADIVVAAVGRPGLLRGENLKDGAIVIDVGINRLEDGRLVGDADFDSCAERAGAITPVPGGVGPMTIAMLLQNTLEAARRRGTTPSA